MLIEVDDIEICAEWEIKDWTIITNNNSMED